MDLGIFKGQRGGGIITAKNTYALRGRHLSSPLKCIRCSGEAIIRCFNIFLFQVYLIYIYVCVSNDSILRYNLNSIISYDISYDLPMKGGHTPPRPPPPNHLWEYRLPLKKALNFFFGGGGRGIGHI